MTVLAAVGGIGSVGAYAAALALLVGPGYFVARALRSSAPVLGGFVLSLLLLLHGVFWLNLVGVPITFAALLGWELGWTALAIVAARRWGAPAGIHRVGALRDGALTACIALVAVSAAALLLRTWLVPLSGPDNPSRFDLLAVRLLELRHLRFYPPVTDAQFSAYGFPESIPPMLSVVYAWLYAAWGEHRPPLTAPFIALQFTFMAAVAYRLATAPGTDTPRAAGALAPVLVACSPLVLFSMLLGQEAGLMAVAVGAMIYFILVDRSDWRGAVLAGAAGGLAALTREYGLACVALGAVLALWQRCTPRWTAVYVATAAALAAPWYLRTWVLTGSPVYSVPVGHLFTENSVVADFYRSVRDRQGITHLAPWQWKQLGHWLITLAPLHVTAGLVAMVALARRRSAIVIGAVALTALWLSSLGLSNSLLIWLRTLTPAVVLVSALLGPFLARGLSRGAAARMVILATVLVCWAYTLVFTLLYPQHIGDVAPERWADAALGRQARRWEWEQFRDAAPSLLPPGARVLSADMYVHTALHGTPNEGPVVWQPEVGYLFDPAVDAANATRRLRDAGVGAIWFGRGDLWEAFLRARSPLFASLGGSESQWQPIATFGPVTLYAPREATAPPAAK